MNKQEQLNSDKEVLASLEAEYKRAQRVIYSIRALVTDLNFEELIPDSQERCLMVDELQAYDYIRTNLMNRIRFYRARVKGAEQSCQICGDAISTQQHHCGQDASCPVGGGCATVQDPNESQPADTSVSLNDLLGMEVISVGGMPCDACNPDNYAGRPCVKVELVGGTYLCLAPRPNSIITE